MRRAYTVHTAQVLTEQYVRLHQEGNTDALQLYATACTVRSLRAALLLAIAICIHAQYTSAWHARVRIFMH